MKEFVHGDLGRTRPNMGEILVRARAYIWWSRGAGTANARLTHTHTHARTTTQQGTETDIMQLDVMKLILGHPTAAAAAAAAANDSDDGD